MMVQTYFSDEEIGSVPKMWDNADGVSWFRRTVKDYTESGQSIDGILYHNYMMQQRRDGDTRDSVRVATWIDRVNGNRHQLATLGDIFILNDEGKTVVRV